MIEYIAVVTAVLSSFGVGWITSYLYHTRDSGKIEDVEVTMNSDVGGMV